MPKPVTRSLKFEIQRIFGHCAAKAQRYALSNLVPADLQGAVVDAISDEGIPQSEDVSCDLTMAILAIQKQWRGRVLRLRDVWSKLQTPNYLYDALNCPPVGVSTNQTNLATCKEYRICPFCWARRYARELYRSVEYACFGHNRTAWLNAAAKLKDEEDLYLQRDLVTIITRRWFDQGGVSLPTVLQEVKLRKSVRTFACRGAFVLNTVEPVRSEKAREWLWTKRTLLLLDLAQPTPAELPAVDGFEQRVKRTFACTRENIAGAVGRVCSYPEMMLRASVEEIAPLLKRIAGQRNVYMSSYRGELRNLSARKRIAQGLSSYMLEE